MPYTLLDTHRKVNDKAMYVQWDHLVVMGISSLFSWPGFNLFRELFLTWKKDWQNAPMEDGINLAIHVKILLES